MTDEKLAKPTIAERQRAFDKRWAEITNCDAGIELPSDEDLLDRIGTLESIFGQLPASIQSLQNLLADELGLDAAAVSQRHALLSLQDKSKLRALSVVGEKDRFEVISQLCQVPSSEISSLISMFFDKYIKLRDNYKVNSEQDQQQTDTSLRKEFKPAKQVPRWADDLRPTERFQMQVSPQMLEHIDAAAKAADMNRTEWFVEKITKYLNASASNTPSEFPDFRTSKQIPFRLDPDLIKKIEDAAESTGLKKTVWARRVLHQALAADTVRPSPNFSL